MADPTSPTGTYVQQIINENVNKAEQYIWAAQEYMRQISETYQNIQNDAPTDWFVDVNVGADTPMSWTNPVVVNAAPVEPAYGTEAVEIPEDVVVPEVFTPSGITNVQQAPDWDLDLDEPPTSPTLLAYSALPTLEPLPLIDIDIPPFDVDLLTTEFSFTEAPYTERVAQENEAEILRVLGGDLGIPQEYWDDMWAKVAGDLAEQQVGLARNARNRGAASYWGLPTEAVLTVSRAVQDEYNKKLQLVRIEQAQKQAELAHDDFWKAVDAALKYEQQWIDFHNQVQIRALTAAQALATIAIQVHNENVAWYNAMLQGAKLEAEVLTLEVETILKKYEAQLRINQAQIEQNKGVTEVYQAEVQAYSVSQTMQIQAIAEKIKWWNATWGADLAYKNLTLERTKIDISNYAALLSKIEALSRGAATLLQARTGVSEFTLKNQLGILSQDEKRNASVFDGARIIQAAQEVNAKLQIEQVQWLGGQGNALLQNLAQLANGLAQALITVSDVNLGSSYSNSDGYSITASRNAEKVW